MFQGMKIKKKEQMFCGCINIFTLALSLSILDLFLTAGFYMYGVISYQLITTPMNFVIIFGLLALIQVTAIHGIYFKNFGIIFFNCVFKLFCLFLCCVLFIIAIVSVLSRSHKYVSDDVLKMDFLVLSLN